MRAIGFLILGFLLAVVVAFVIAASINLSAVRPGRLELAVINRLKRVRVGGKDQTDPLPDTPDTIKMGAEHFQHHCGICHGLDGQNTGVPFAGKISPPVANLASARVQRYSDGQLKWIIDNGIRFTGMPGWKGVLEDDEAWAVVRYIRHLPAKGSLGAPAVYKEEEAEHERMESGAEHGQPAPVPAKEAPQTHSHPHH